MWCSLLRALCVTGLRVLITTEGYVNGHYMCMDCLLICIEAVYLPWRVESAVYSHEYVQVMSS